VRAVLRRTMRTARVDTGTQILVQRTVAVVILVVGVFFVMGTLGVSQTTLFTLLGAAGLALSLAAQDILKNFFSGVYLLLERPFHVGDTIKVKDHLGTVENVGVRTTTLRTPDHVQVMVPNAVVFAEVVAKHGRGHELPPTGGPQGAHGEPGLGTGEPGLATGAPRDAPGPSGPGSDGGRA
jgi:small conductance mechanosensitive channel